MTERLNRDAVERVLARAHELEPAAPSHAADGVEPEALIAAAAEVGMDPDAVRDSLAIERLSISEPPLRRFDRLAGASEIVVEHEVHLSVEQVLAGFETWLTSLYRLRCHRRSDGSLFAARRSDAPALLARTLSTARGEGRLAAKALVIEAVPQTVSTTPGRPRALVRIGADRSTPRRVRLVGGGSVAGTGVGMAGGATAAFGAVDAVVAFPAIALPLSVVGYAVARSGRGQADRLESELERLLSRVERGDQPTGLLGRVALRARRAAERVR